MRVLDRYLIRETIAPFFLALAVYTFVLAVDPMLTRAEGLLAKGVPVQTVGFLLLTLLPQALGVTIPMAYLTGLLMALGRMSGDRESVALLACGVSPVRLLRPVLMLGAVVGMLDLYVMVRAVPDGNMAFVEATWKLLTQQSEADIKPQVFFEKFPGYLMYANDTQPGGGWKGVFLAEMGQGPQRTGTPTVTLAESGSLQIQNDPDPHKRFVRLVLNKATRYSPGEEESRVYSMSRQDPVSLAISPESVFGAGQIGRGLPEMRISDLNEEIARKYAAGDTPHNEIMYLHQKFSFPVACLVFSLLGLALGLNTRKEGKLAGLTLGVAVILVYWGLLGLAESWTKAGNWGGARGGFPAWLARWFPNIILGIVGIIAVWWRGRSSGGALTLEVPGWLTRWRKKKPVAAAATAAGDGKPAAAPPRPVLVIRIPRLSIPAPRLLDRYVGARYLRMLMLAFVSLLALFYIGTFLDLSDKLFKGQADGWMFMRYLWYSTPQIIVFVLPSAVLVAVLGTIGGLMRNGELTVMRACGVSLYRTALPLMVLGLMWSGMLFLFDEHVLATSKRKADVLEDTIRGRAPHTYEIGNQSWFHKDGRIYYYVVMDKPRQTVHGLSVFETARGPYRLLSHTYAARAVHRASTWQLEDGWTQRFQANDQVTREPVAKSAATLASLEDFQRAQIDTSQMKFGQLREHVQRLGASGYNVAEQRVNLHRKVAFPAVTLVMTLLAVPFGVTIGRGGTLYGFGAAIVLSFAYWLLTTFFMAVGGAAMLPAALAAWAANILFLAAAIYLMLTVRT